LWLDELEDLIFTIAALWEQVRGAVLQVGLLAALALQSSGWWSGAAAHASLLASIAFSSVVVWAFGMVMPLRGAFRRQRIPSST
jgi:hypothetical protein